MTLDQGMRISGHQRPVDLIDIVQRGSRMAPDSKTDRTSFKKMFSREMAQSCNVTFSQHAHERLHSRGVELSEENLTKLAVAIDRAEAKGSRETLVLADDTAYVVSVKNRTVITVFDRDNLRDGIVTSIDSAVIL